MGDRSIRLYLSAQTKHTHRHTATPPIKRWYPFSHVRFIVSTGSNTLVKVFDLHMPKHKINNYINASFTRFSRCNPNLPHDLPTSPSTPLMMILPRVTRSSSH